MSVADKLARKSSTNDQSRQVRLHLVRLDVWSIVKLSLLLGAFLGVVGTLSTLLVWAVLYQTGAFDQIDALISGVPVGSPGASNGVKAALGFGTVAGASVFVGVVGLVGGAIIGALASVLYNVSVRFTGGVLFGFSSSSRRANDTSPHR